MHTLTHACAQEQREIQSEMNFSGNNAKSFLIYAQVTMYLLNFSTEQVRSAGQVCLRSNSAQSKCVE